MDYHNEMIKERDTKIKELEGKIVKFLVIEEEKAERIKCLENIITYLEHKLRLN